MTPQQKAKELVNKYMFLGNVVNSIGFAKQCALILADEVLNTTISEKRRELIMLVSGMVFPYHYEDYWLRVKKEIEKL